MAGYHIAGKINIGQAIVVKITDANANTILIETGTNGQVTKVTDGRKSVYEITDGGLAELAAREADLADIEDGLTDSVRRLADGMRAEVQEAMRSLRADLASAARQSRADAKEATAEPEESERSASMAAVREAEHVLNEFRQSVHTDFRLQAARGHVPGDAVTDLRQRLTRVRDEVLGRLGE